MKCFFEEDRLLYEAHLANLKAMEPEQYENPQNED
jgi:hypothetical protein